MASGVERSHWHPDILGPPFESLTLPLGEDEEGEVVATLVRYARKRRFTPAPLAANGIDVLYLHGWSDYFFQAELAEFFWRAGARFFALDLRKYGRSLRPGQTPGYVTDLGQYDADIEAALAAMGRSRPLLLLGHSTGGLVFSLWAARNPGRAHGLILNSPWLEFQTSRRGREAVAPLIGLQARIDPRGPLPNLDFGFYARAVDADKDGSWHYDHRLRPPRGFSARPAWLAAILAGQSRVAAGLGLTLPILTLLSARSTLAARWSPEMLSSDSVLVVEDIARQALKLGPTVTVARINGALHDIFLSREPVRRAAYSEITRWLAGYGRVVANPTVSGSSRIADRVPDLLP